MKISTRLIRGLNDAKSIFNVTPFIKPLEQQFQKEQSKTSCTFLGVASLVGFTAYTFYFFLFIFELWGVKDLGNSTFSRLLLQGICLYFGFTAYILLFSESSDRVKELVAQSFAYGMVLLIPTVNLFKPTDKVGYDIMIMTSTVLCIAGASRFTHKKACIWLVIGYSAFFLVQLFFFGIFGPDVGRPSDKAPLMSTPLLNLLYFQVIQACIFAYMIFRVIEARERVLFLREHQLAKAAEERLRLLQGIGHDLRQPMTALMLHSDFARQRAAAADYKQMSESLRVIEDNLHLMNSELTQVTELAASADPTGNFVLKSVPVFRTLESLVEAFRPRAVGSHIDLKLLLPQNPPNLDIFSDDLLIRRCLSNLISNAFKFTEVQPDENPKIITIGLNTFESFAEITIEDSGIGIAPENLEKIWEPFFQVGNPARNSEMGFGLGLAHVRAAIDRMPGHSISVSSILGEGTKFTIRVSLSNEPELPEETSLPANEQEPGRAWAFEGSLILLVEDDTLLRSSLSRGFETWGARVAEADSVESAKKLIDSLEVPPDFAIVDFRLPDGDARDVFKYIEASRAHTEGCECHWICLTGEHSTNLKKLEGTRISVIRKPVNLAMLRNRMIEIANASDGI
jgi:signal transduction histidine kinase/CheY-like chemotaxis protein